MAESHGPRLVQACEALCERLRRDVGLTDFRIELRRAPTPLVISLHSREPVPFDPREAWMRPVPAQLGFDVRAPSGVVARVVIEDGRRTEYPETAKTACERIAGEYVGTFEALLVASEL